jgi:putative DNA primase/helicase
MAEDMSGALPWTVEQPEIIPPDRAMTPLADPARAADGLYLQATGADVNDAVKRVLISGFDAATELQALAAIRKVIKWTKPEFAKVVKSLKRSSSSRRWVDAIPTFENGEPKPLMISATIGLEFDDEWRDVIWFNDFTGMIWFRRCPPYEEAAGEECDRAWTDDDELATTHWMQGAGLTTPRNVVFEAVAHAAAQNRFHPAREYFDSLEWDEVERLKKPSRYFGCKDTPYTIAVFSKWMIGLVARVYVPGCKCDTCLILEGIQGLGKSTVFKILAGREQWFTDEIGDLGSKDAVLAMRGKLVIELAELDSLSRTGVSRTKAFMSRSVDRYRPPYGRQSVDAPRQCIFGGTVNDDEYLKDATGGRRFWPLACGVINLDALNEDIRQLHAEAVFCFRRGDKWYLDDPDVIALAEQEQANRYETDARESVIAEWLETHPIVPGTEHRADRVTMAEVLGGALGLDVAKWTKSEQMQASACLKRLDWTKDRNGRARFYWRPGFAPKDGAVVTTP